MLDHTSSRSLALLLVLAFFWCIAPDTERSAELADRPVAVHARVAEAESEAPPPVPAASLADATRLSVRLDPCGAAGCELRFRFSLPMVGRDGLAGAKPLDVAFDPPLETRIFEILPPQFAEWQAAHGVAPPPSRFSPLCPSTGPVPGALVVTYPRNGEVFLIEPGYGRRTQSLPLSAEVDPYLPRVTWLLDGAPVANVAWPYETAWPLAEGRHRVQVVAQGMNSDPVEFEVW